MVRKNFGFLKSKKIANFMGDKGRHGEGGGVKGIVNLLPKTFISLNTENLPTPLQGGVGRGNGRTASYHRPGILGL